MSVCDVFFGVSPACKQSVKFKRRSMITPVFTVCAQKTILLSIEYAPTQLQSWGMLGRSRQNEIKNVSGIAISLHHYTTPDPDVYVVGFWISFTAAEKLEICFDETCVRQHEMSNGNDKRHQLLSPQRSHAILKLQGLCCRGRGTHWGVVLGELPGFFLRVANWQKSSE